MEPADLVKVYELANQVHSLYEAPEIFMERQALFPEGCFVLGDVLDDVLGYAITHPFRKESIPLNTLLHALPADADCWYIHDLVIHPSQRQQGHTKSLLAKVTDLARTHASCLTLTSVNETESFWTHLGFKSSVSISCESYGPSVFMIKHLRCS
jgi:GNAT superfamily N-acetyltransferase